MLTVKVEGIEELTRGLNDLAMSQVPWATVTALTWTGYSAKKRLYAEMRSKFDRPSPFVVPPASFDREDGVGSMRVEWATLAKPYAVVKMKDWAAGKQRVATDPLLRHHFFGGARVYKGLEKDLVGMRFMKQGEFIVPGAGAKLDRYGNMSLGQIQQIRSQLAVSVSGADNAATGSRRSKTNVAKAGVMFWSMGPEGQAPGKVKIDPETGIAYGTEGRSGRANHLPKGLWIRDGRNVHPILFVLKKAPTYRQLFDLRQIAADAVREDFAKNFRAALKKAIANSGHKGKWRR